MNKRLLRRSVGQRAPVPDSEWCGTCKESHPFYGRGLTLSLPRQTFQLLYKEVGFDLAVDIGVTDSFVLWPAAPPPIHLLKDWALESDLGRDEIPPEVEKAFGKRWENYAKSIAIKTVRGTARLSQDFTRLASTLYREASDGNIDEDKLRLVKDTTSVLMHANNGTGFIYRELVGGAKKEAAPQQINNFLLNAGEKPKKLRTNGRPDRRSLPSPKRIEQAIPAEYREVPVGN